MNGNDRQFLFGMSPDMLAFDKFVFLTINFYWKHLKMAYKLHLSKA